MAVQTESDRGGTIATNIASATDPSYRQFCANWRVWFKDQVIHPAVDQYWPQCLAVERMSRDQLLSLQQKRLTELVASVVKHVPFYRQWAKEHGYQPGDSLKLEDLPIVSKQDYRRDIEAFQSDEIPIDRMMSEETSGSTGEPFRFRKLKIESDYSYCCIWRSLRRHGLRSGDRRVYIWGRNPGFHQSPLQRRLLKTKLAIRNWLNNTLSPDAHQLDHRTASAVLDCIESYRPVYMHGYTSALYAVAQAMNEQGRRLQGFKLKAVITDAEKLYDFQKEAMEKAFQCPIVEHYGSVEFGNIAQRDPQGLMRINEDLCIVERLPTGESVMTNLYAKSFPFIRYKNGDMIELDDDITGPLPFRTISKIMGRTIDLVPVPRGGYVHGFTLLWAIVPHLQHIRRYQVHQLQLDHFKIKCVVASPLPETIRAKIVQDFRTTVGEQTRVEIEEVDTIPTSASGKFRWLISDVSNAARQMLAESHQTTDTPACQASQAASSLRAS